MPPTPPRPTDETAIERFIASIGSVPSLLLHTAVFAGFFSLSVLGFVEWSLMLLILTTILSLEAIYLAIFIQITVNRHTKSLREVEEDIDEIQEDVEELGEDLEDIQEDIEEISEDIEGISEDIDEIQEDVEEMNEDDDDPKEQERKKEKVKKKVEDVNDTLNRLSKDVARVLADLEALKEGK